MLYLIEIDFNNETKSNMASVKTTNHIKKVSTILYSSINNKKNYGGNDRYKGLLYVMKYGPYRCTKLHIPFMLIIFYHKDNKNIVTFDQVCNRSTFKFTLCR